MLGMCITQTLTLWRNALRAPPNLAAYKMENGFFNKNPKFGRKKIFCHRDSNFNIYQC